jgi:ABC-type transport system involved in multi-copper enzyme maturation permease subunit
VSISPPRLSAGAVPRRGREHRVFAIWRHEVGALAGWGTWFVVAIIYLAVVLIVVVRAELASLTGGVVLSTFFSPYASPVWPLFLLIVTTAVASGSISDDLGSRAITLYLARPIDSTDYLVAKASAVGFWIAVAAIGPGIVGVTLATLLGLVSGPVAASAAGAFLGIGLLASLFFTGVGVFLSSLTNRALFAGAGIFGGVLCAEIVGGAIGGATGNVPIQYLDVFGDITTAAQSAFDAGGSPTTNPATGALLIAAAGAILLVLAWVRLQAVEVVGE